MGVVFHGTDGYVVLTRYEGGAAFDRDGKLVTKLEGPDDTLKHHRNFIDAVRSRKRADLHAAEAKLNELQTGSRPQEIQQARGEAEGGDEQENRTKTDPVFFQGVHGQGRAVYPTAVDRG